MRRLLWTRRALRDLKNIHSFVAEDSKQYANVVVSRIQAAVEKLADFPELGRQDPEHARAEIRETIQAPYRIERS